MLTGDRAGWLSVCADRHPTEPIPRLPCSTLFQLSTQPNSHSKAISSIRQEARLSAPDPRFWKQWKFPNQSQPTTSLTSRLRTHCDARFSAFLPPAASQWSGGRLIYSIGWADPTAVSGQAGIPWSQSQSRSQSVEAWLGPAQLTATAALFRTAVVNRPGLPFDTPDGE